MGYVFAGSGVFKGYNNVEDLIRCLFPKKDALAEALEQWSIMQV